MMFGFLLSSRRAFGRQQNRHAVARMGGPGHAPAAARTYVSIKARMLGGQAQTVTRRRGVWR